MNISHYSKDVVDELLILNNKWSNFLSIQSSLLWVEYWQYRRLNNYLYVIIAKK